MKLREDFMVSGLNRQVFTQISYGLYIVTSHLAGKLNGQIVNTVLQVTSEPPRVAVIINKNNLTHEFISKSRVFGASVLDTSTPMTFIGLFGFKSGRTEDKLSKVQFINGTTGVPLVTEHALSVLEARVIDEVDVGTHTLFVGDVVTAEVLRNGEPLTYSYYHNNLKGKSPKTAPTYNPEK
jgi:ferric-chelate reductase [NAD(P)H]